MDKNYEYITFGQIQKIKQMSYEKGGREIEFFEAVERLVNGGKTYHGTPKVPDFLSWNLISLSEFKELIYQIPIPTQEILSLTRKIDKENIYLPVQNPVQISMESCYNTPSLIVLPYFLIVYVLEGSCILNYKNTARHLKKGELAVLPPNLPYSLITSPKDFVITIISEKEQFKKNFIDTLHHNNILADFFRKVILQESDDVFFFMLPPSRDVKNIIQHLFAEFVKRDIYSESLFYSYLQIFYGNIVRAMKNNYSYFAKQKENSGKASMPAILEYINQNYQELTLSMLSEYFHYESSYLSRLIKKTTGRNYTSILNEIRVNQAVNLLQSTTQSIEEIAYKTGFNSADHFTYTFKKYQHCSPSTFRKVQKN